ncbi:MAG TPA: hypothetical protein DCE71_01630 [Parachlamydiales bacterium]|nr:hypothetical protein [Parachlamydiales bacterium]
MAALGNSDIGQLFRETFCTRDLEQRDLFRFGKETMGVEFFSFSSEEIAEKIKEQDLELFKQMYFVAEALKGRVQLTDPMSIALCDKNLEKLWRGVFVEKRSSYLARSSPGTLLTVSLENLGNPEEVIALEDAGFSPAKAAELEKSLAAITQTISVSVRDPESLTEEENQKIAAIQGKGIVVVPWQTTSCDPTYSSYLIVHGNQLPLNRIPLEEKEKIVQKITTQMRVDFEREYRVAFISSLGLKRFYVEHRQNVGMEEEILFLVKDAKYATKNLFAFVQALPHVTAREQLIILDYSTQTIFNQAAALFYMSYLPKIQECLLTIYPDEIFMPTFEGLSEILHDIENKETTCTQLVSIGDLNLLDDKNQGPVILQFKIEATFDWGSEEMVLNLVELISADTRPFQK